MSFRLNPFTQEEYMHWWAYKRQDRLNRGDVAAIAWFLGNFLALVSLSSVVSLENTSNLVPGFALLLSGAVFIFPRLPGKIPPWFWKLSNVLLVVFLVIDFLRSEFVAALINLNVLLILLRSLAYRRKREDMQLILLCMFVIVICGVLSMSLSFGIHIVLFSCCAMSLLFVINLRENGMEMSAGKETFESFSWVQFIAHIWRKFDLRHFGFGLFLFGILIAFTVIIFVSFPRFHLGKVIPFLQLKNGSSYTGFSEHVRFGEITEIKEDNSIAMRIDIPEVTNFPSAPYWRMLVLDYYFNGHFSVSEDAKAKREQQPESSRFGYRPIFLKQHYPKLDDEKWTFYLEGGISRFLPTTGVYRDLLFQKQQGFYFNPYHHTINTNEVSPSVLFYQVRGMSFEDKIPDAFIPITRTPITRKLLSDPDFFKPSEYPATTLIVPVSEEEKTYLEETADLIWNRIHDRNPVHFAYAASQWLGLKHSYSTNLAAHTGEGDPVISWMRNSSDGHCEYFSGALVLLCRTAGIPARVVTGFHGGSWNGFEDYFMIKNSEAHAWVEIFDGDSYWVRVDPTPGGNQEIMKLNQATAEVSSFVDSSIAAYFDSIRILWYRRVVNFDNQDQIDLLNGVSSSVRELVDKSKLKLSLLLVELRALIEDPFNKERLTLFGMAFLTFFGIYLIIRILLSRIRARAYFKFFGTRKRKRVKQLKDRVLAGQLLERFRRRLIDMELIETVRGSIDELRVIRFGAVDSWPTVNPVLKRARKLIKTF
ncbi:MAG: transglutaminaseTgpA domain-containing protein [Verrucomicrobia bacterium]|nr:transglutaminaseTgpA domain-containing protein [Verrucomicrobiota bacterium]